MKAIRIAALIILASSLRSNPGRAVWSHGDPLTNKRLPLSRESIGIEMGLFLP